METTGIMNAKLRLQLPGYITFDDCRVVPFSRGRTERVCDQPGGQLQRYGQSELPAGASSIEIKEESSAA